MSDEVKEITALFKSLTGMLKADYGDRGGVSKLKGHVKSLQEKQPEFVDPEFESAMNDLASAAASRVSVAGDQGEEEPSLASGMAHSGQNPYRKVKEADPKTGTTPKDSAGDADPKHDPTKKKPQPSNRGFSEGHSSGSANDLDSSTGKALT